MAETETPGRDGERDQEPPVAFVWIDELAELFQARTADPAAEALLRSTRLVYQARAAWLGLREPGPGDAARLAPRIITATTAATHIVLD